MLYKVHKYNILYYKKKDTKNRVLILMKIVLLCS